MPLPKRPETLSDLAIAALVALSGDPASGQIILGGGVALKHYDDFRATQDIDAWWRDYPDANAMSGFKDRLGLVAKRHGLSLEARRFGATDSIEFKDSSAKKVFSFQIAVRDVPLEEPVASAWPPILIETFSDNVGSKMNALVNRGAPRDFVDIYRVVADGLIARDRCWYLWQLKNTGADIQEARERVLTHLSRLELRRPLHTIMDAKERETSQTLRNWYRAHFLAA